MLCGYETNFRKNLYRHYINASTCRTPAVLNKKPTNKGSVKPVSSKPTSKPVVSRGKVIVVKPVSSRPTVVLESAEPHSDQAEEIEETSEITPPDFIAKQLPEWRIGEDLPEKICSVVFSKDPRTLYDTKDQLLTSLENVKPDYYTQDVPEEYMNALEQACGATTETELQEALSKNKDFTEYVSPDQPTGRIGLRDDFQYIWKVLKRIRGKGKPKKPETIIQYCRILFGHGSNSLYNFLESRGQMLEEYLYPQGMSWLIGPTIKQIHQLKVRRL